MKKSFWTIGACLMLGVYSANSSAGTLTVRGQAAGYGGNTVNRVIIKNCSGSYKILSGSSSTDTSTVCSAGTVFSLDVTYPRLTSTLADTGTLTGIEFSVSYYAGTTLSQLMQFIGSGTPSSDQRLLVQEASKCWNLLKTGVSSTFAVTVESNNNLVQCGDLTP